MQVGQIIGVFKCFYTHSQATRNFPLLVKYSLKQKGGGMAKINILWGRESHIWLGVRGVYTQPIANHGD
jgi:hypothetical protein